jgi:hypothetical protein
MNTLFVVIMWSAVYYLFFCPLSEVEEWQRTIDPIYREFAEGYDEG